MTMQKPSTKYLLVVLHSYYNYGRMRTCHKSSELATNGSHFSPQLYFMGVKKKWGNHWKRCFWFHPTWNDLTLPPRILLLPVFRFGLYRRCELATILGNLSQIRQYKKWKCRVSPHARLANLCTTIFMNFYSTNYIQRSVTPFSFDF